MSTVTRRVENTLPETGSREWWALYIFTPVLLIGVALLAFPTIVYDRFIWQYLWGPVVADAASQPVTYEGVRAVRGYNVVNTATYLGIIGYSLWGLRAFLNRIDLELTTRLAYGLAPIIIAGGAMRALEDIDLLGDFAVLFITPTIYFVVTFVALVGIGVGAALRDWGLISIPQTVGAIGTLWAVGAISRALLYGMRSPAQIRWWVPAVTGGIALTLTALLYAIARFNWASYLQHPMYLLAFFGQMWDGAQNLVGTTFLGYQSKMYLTHLIYRITGFSGATFLIKLAVIMFLIWSIADAKDEMSHTWWWVLVVGIIAVGLPMGIRGSLRMMLGV